MKMKKVDDEEIEESNDSEDELREQQTRIALDRDADVLATIEAFKGTGVSGSEIGIRRRAPNGTVFQYCGTWPVEDFTLEAVKQAYGGGDYKVQHKTKEGKFGKSIQFAINYAAKAATDPVTGQNNNTDQTALVEAIRTLRDLKAAPAPSSDGLNSQTIMTIMMESSKQQMMMMAEVAKAIAGRPAETTRPGVDVVGLITALSPLAIAVLNRPAGGVGSLKEQVETLKSLKDVVENNESDPSMLDKIMKVAGPLAGPIVGALMNRGQPQMMPAPQTQVQTEQQPQQQIAQSSEAGPVPVQQSPRLCDIIRPYFPILVNSAAKGSDPEFVLDMIDEVVDPRLVVLVTDALKQENWRETLFENHPLVTGQYKAWFDKLRECALTSDVNESQSDIDYPASRDNGSPGIAIASPSNIVAKPAG